MRVDHEKKSHGEELTMRKSHGVDHEKKSDRGELTMRKRAMG